MIKKLRSMGLTPDIAYGAALVSMALSVILWFLPRSGDEADKGRPERLAIFVGLWPPTLAILGHALREEERSEKTAENLLG
jgi:hypothetical protein